MMTTHDAAITPSGPLLPGPLLDAISYTADDEPLTDDVLKWLPKFRQVAQHTTDVIVITGISVREIQQMHSRYFKSARPWAKRVEVFDNDKDKDRNRVLPLNAGLLVIMKFLGHDRSIALKNQALARKPSVPILIGASNRDLRQLLLYGFLLPEHFERRVRPKFPHSYQSLDASARALMQVQANATIRRLAYGDAVRKSAPSSLPMDESAMDDQPTAAKPRAARGALKAFMARHPTPEEMDTPDWKAAKNDEQRGAFLLKIAHAEGLPTTIGSVVNAVRDLRKAADAAHKADADRAALRAQVTTDFVDSLSRGDAAGLPLDPPPPPPASPPAPPSHPTLASAHTAIQQGFDALAKARDLYQQIGEQLEMAEMALQDAQRYTGPDLIVEMQKGLQAALHDAMVAKFGQFLPWSKSS